MRGTGHRRGEGAGDSSVLKFANVFTHPYAFASSTEAEPYCTLRTDATVACGATFWAWLTCLGRRQEVASLTLAARRRVLACHTVRHNAGHTLVVLEEVARLALLALPRTDAPEAILGAVLYSAQRVEGGRGEVQLRAELEGCH